MFTMDESPLAKAAKGKNSPPQQLPSPSVVTSPIEAAGKGSVDEHVLIVSPTTPVGYRKKKGARAIPLCDLDSALYVAA